MAKKKRKKPSAKRFTINQTIQQVHEAYDHLEVIAIRTAERALREQFGFGDVRLKRFKDAYLMAFGEEAANYAEEVRNKMRRGL